MIQFIYELRPGCGLIHILLYIKGASQVALVVKNSHSNEEVRDAVSIPGLGRSPGVGNGNPLQCSCRENPMDRGVWWDTVYGAAKSQTGLK